MRESLFFFLSFMDILKRITAHSEKKLGQNLAKNLLKKLNHNKWKKKPWRDWAASQPAKEWLSYLVMDTPEEEVPDYDVEGGGDDGGGAGAPEEEEEEEAEEMEEEEATLNPWLPEYPLATSSGE